MDDYTAQSSQPGSVPGTQTGDNGSSECAAENTTRSTLSQKASEVREKASDLSRRTYASVDNTRQSAASALETTASSLHSSGERVSNAAHTAARKLEATADYVRQNDLRQMGNEVMDLVKRHPGQSLAIAAACGFLLARTLRSRD